MTVQGPTEKQLLKLLVEIEIGRVALTLDRIASAEAILEDYGNIHLITSNKYRMGIFVDSGELNHISYIQYGPTMIGYTELAKKYPNVRNYSSGFLRAELVENAWKEIIKRYANN